MRVALGAGRGRIVLQLLTEGVVLALASVPLGVVLATVGVRLIRSQIPPDSIPYYIQFTIDVRSLAYAVAVALVTSLVFGLVPALQVTRRELQENLKEGARGSTGRGAFVRNALVVSQVSLALVALVGALLFVRSFTNLDGFRVGFDTASALSLRFFMAGVPYNPTGAKTLRVEDIVRRVEALPGVQSAFASNLVPIAGGGTAPTIEVDGRATDQRHEIIPLPPHRTVLDARRSRAAGAGPRRHRLERRRRRRQRVHGKRSVAERERHRSAIQARRPRGAPEWITVIGIVPDLHLWGVDPNNSQMPPTAFAPLPVR